MTLPLTVDDHSDHDDPEIDEPITIKNHTVNVHTLHEPHAQDNTRILLVEDQPMVAKVAQDMLQHCGCRSTIDWAPTGEIALQKASGNAYDLILMDIGLPNMQGTEVTTKIRALQDPIKAKVPIVALTGHADSEHKQAFQAIGMQDLIIKPATNASLTRILNAYVFPNSNVMSQDKQQDTSTTNDMVLDWAACMQLDNVKNDAKLLQEYLSLMSGELTVTKKIFINGFNTKNTKALRAELHRIRGALTYLVMPEMTHAMKAFHNALRAEPHDATIIKATYRAAIAAIDHFQQAYAQGLNGV